MLGIHEGNLLRRADVTVLKDSPTSSVVEFDLPGPGPARRVIYKRFAVTKWVDPWAALVYVKARGHRFVLPQAPSLFAAGRGFVETAHADGIRVGTWTVDDPEAIERLFDMGVDAVATNDPEKAIPARDRHRSST